MPGWTLATLPQGFTVKRTVVTNNIGAVTSETYTIRGYQQSSPPLDTGSDTFQSDLDAFVDATIPAVYRYTNQQSVIHERNRWLAQTDPYVLPAASLPADMPADVLAAISDTTNQQAIKTWRQQLRDYPSTVTDWARPPALPSPPAILLPSGRALIIVT